MKIAIGCLVQWYECDIIEQYLKTLRRAREEAEKSNFKIEIISEVMIGGENKWLEQCVSAEQYNECIAKIVRLLENYNVVVEKCPMTKDSLPYTIADYRREFNTKWAEKCDVVVWGESDMLVPQGMFINLAQLHNSVGETTPKYIATFAGCKMWDDSWKMLEHPEFTDKAHSDSKEDWWSLNYDMSIEEMDNFNSKYPQVTVQKLPSHKFNGCGLVISSEVIKAGINVPQAAFFIHEDTALMKVLAALLPQVPQYHFKNVLLVHNRKHKDKRKYIAFESGETMGQKRNSNKWYGIANRLCEQNVYNLFTPNFKFHTWETVQRALKVSQ